MANRWKGNIIAVAATTSSGTAYTGVANGAWGLNSQLQQKNASIWAVGLGTALTPTIGTATATSESTVDVTFTPAATGGVSTSYTATSTPSGITGTSSASPITVSGLSAGVSYTFSVYAVSSSGIPSLPSASSNSATPALPQAVTAGGDSSGVSTYPWTPALGFGTRYANPATTPGEIAYNFTYASSNTDIIMGVSTTPFLHAYRWTSSGFGTKYSNPSSLTPSASKAVTYNSNQNTIFVGTSGSPYINAYPWTHDVGFGTKYSNPSTLPNSGCNDGAVGTLNNSSSIVAIGYQASPWVSMYPFSSGFGTKYANPTVTAITAKVYSITFNPVGNAVAISYNASPIVTVYNWTTGSGVGTAFSNPATIPTGTTGQNQARFNLAGTVIGVAYATSPYVSTYPWSSGFGTKYADPVTSPAVSLTGLAFSRDGDAIALTSTSSPFLMAYTWSAGFGTKYANPSPTTSAQSNFFGALAYI